MIIFNPFSFILFASFTMKVLVNSAESKLNVIFIMTDDLRPELSIYGRKHIISPNFERLARKSVVFDRAYNQLAVCFPSRHSLLTGMRPDTPGIHTWTDAQNTNMDSLFNILVRNEYYSAGIGKLFHHPRNGSHEFPDGRWDGLWYKFQGYEQSFLNSSVTPDSNFKIEEFRDYIIADRAIAKIKELNAKSAETKRPFAVSIGFKQPHTSYHLPREYFDMYRHNSYLENILNSTDELQYLYPVGAPLQNYRCCAFFRFWPMIDEGRKKSSVYGKKVELYGLYRLPNRAIYELQWGYFGGITFLDAMLGRVLDTLDELNLWQNTLVVFTSDHGMHIGDKGMWEKYTLFEETTRVPLLIADPRHPQHHGSHYPEPVEILDVIPTMIDLLGISRIPVLCPRDRRCFEFEGKSLANVVRSGPAAEVPGIKFALTQMRRCQYLKTDKHRSSHPDDIWTAICGMKNRLQVPNVMGYSLRTRDWRYTAWFSYIEKKMRPDLGKIVAEELYDHRGAAVADFDNRERVNMAYSTKPAAVEAVHDLRFQLQQFLFTKSHFSFQMARNYTSELYKPFFDIDKSGFAISDEPKSKVVHKKLAENGRNKPTLSLKTTAQS